MLNKKEVEYVKEIVSKINFKEGANPDKILIGVIKQIYGHQVDIDKFIELIETSPLEY